MPRGRQPGSTQRKTCTDHCAGCGEHFHGLSAFDAHRRDQQCCNPATVARKGNLLLQVWTEAGSCDKERGCWHNGVRQHWDTPVRIWQMAMSEATRNRLSQLGGQKSDGFSAPALVGHG